MGKEILKSFLRKMRICRTEALVEKSPCAMVADIPRRHRFRSGNNAVDA